ncbi:synaptonemal complex protein 1 [Ahaetulla prasina]|uniref:synaptonemal complex protein 1 n=1 Tax=Ahaetulla prasina TaxID=499056 RepID=UPI002647389A|nr:synaptonemal complex protein 1 [Ahaetulla prasina]
MKTSMSEKEEEKSFKFKLFVPPRLSNTQVSAVKPQSSTRDEGFFQNFSNRTEDYYNSSYRMKNVSKPIEVIASSIPLFSQSFTTKKKIEIWTEMLKSKIDHGSRPEILEIDPKIKTIPDNIANITNMETMNELYSRLYKEAEKIKRWKVSVQYELKEKEKKMQENRKIIEALRKAIQELQGTSSADNHSYSLPVFSFTTVTTLMDLEYLETGVKFENEKLSLKLEDEIHENNELLKENNATRHLCNLLKEKCMQSVEKCNKYECEREETRQMYVDLNNNIERMIKAFEELRVEAENIRLEKYYKIKEAADKIEQLEKEHKREINSLEKEISLLKEENGKKDNKIKQTDSQLQESRLLILEFEEIRKQQDEIIKKAESKQQNFLAELENTTQSLEDTKNTCKNLETELQITVKTLAEVTEQKELIIREFEETRVLHASVTDGFQIEVSNLKELLLKEENRQKELRDASDALVLKLQNKSTELEMMTKLKNDKEKQIEELEPVLVQVQEFLHEKQILGKTVEKLQETERELKDTLQTREKERHDLEMQLSDEFENKQNYFQQLATLKTELEKEILKNKELNMGWNKILFEKEQIITEKKMVDDELQKCKDTIKNVKNTDEETKNQIDILKQANLLLSNELKEVMEKLKQKDEEAKNKADENEENVRNIENEISKKEKQLKALESKVNSLKKQIEMKIKNIEVLQQENKSLKKKLGSESKQLSITEEKVNNLELELENTNRLYKETSDNYKNEIEMSKTNEKRLLKEIETMNSLTNEAVAMKKEIDIRCQHKITEMVALMEKHKHQYDKTVDEKDTELEFHMTKLQELSTEIESLKNELSCKKSEVFSLQEQLKREINEKENLAKEASQTYTVKTPPKSKLLRESTNLVSEGRKKKRKVILELDSRSDSSENTDLLSIVTEQEMFKKLNKDYSESSHLCIRTPKQIQAPSILKTPGSSMKLATVRKMQEAGWTAISKIDRRKKMKEAGKLFI